METAINIINITKKFGSRNVLDNISFKVNSGEVFGLLGPNGAGKTTLIKTITSLLAIEEGTIEICGCNLEKDFEHAMKNIGSIVENPEMYPYMTGKQNIMQYARMRKGIANERIDEIIEMVGLTNRINEKVGKYSLGMRQRLGLAISLIHNPKVLVLDEPTNGLDPAGIKQLRDILTELAHENDVCVLVSSHLMSEMELMCDRVGIISNGKIIRVDSIENILNVATGDNIIYTYNVSDFDNAKSVINSFNSEFVINMADNEHFELTLPTKNHKENIAKINSMLIKNNIAVYAVVPKENQHLEDAFIELTNGGGSQIA